MCDYPQLIVDLWSSYSLSPNDVVPDVGVPFGDILRAVVFLSLRNGLITLDDIEEAAKQIYEQGGTPRFLWAVLYRNGRPVVVPDNVNLTPIEIDATQAVISNDEDLNIAIRYHSRGVLAQYQFGSEDISHLQTAINNAEVDVVKKLLPFSSSPVTLPKASSSFPLLNQEYRKIIGIVHLHNERIRRKRIHVERSHNLPIPVVNY